MCCFVCMLFCCEGSVFYTGCPNKFGEFVYELYSQSASSLKVIQKSSFVLSRSAPIRCSERSVWASSLPDSFNNVMAFVKREISCLNFFRIVTCISLQSGFSLVGGTGGIPPYEPYVPPHKNGVPPIKSESCPPSSPFIMGGLVGFFYHRTD